ncbi:MULTISPECIES: SigB/SigF/SigG family RNA polymerase sigma factor [Streptomyces]|nr:SigB/SigF/SigG family RNA polymerase sigma factor [Streptomyces niger]
MAASTALRRHPDAPDTDAAFLRLATLPDGPARKRLREEIVCGWLPMANRLARRYSGRGETEEDLRQVAAVGLLKAVDRFDAASGTPFPAYAIPTILGELRRHFRDDLWAVHVPRRTQELRATVHQAREQLEFRNGSAALTIGDLAEHTGLSEEDVVLGLEAQGAYTALSLECPMSTDAGHSFHLADFLGDEDPELELVEERLCAAPVLRALPQRERIILYLRFFRDMTQSQIAEEIGISQMHVSRILQRCCRLVRVEVTPRA